MFTRFFTHPLTRGLDIDSPETTSLRRQIIRSKPFLRKVYEEWYAFELAEIRASPAKGKILELGSGAGFFSELSPGAVTSDLFSVDGISLILDGQFLPFSNGSLKAMVMTNVLHHVPQPELLFAEAARCVASGGVFAMVEPWLTPWSRFVYKYWHHEPVDETTTHWRIQGTGPLSGANTALPWIIFKRDLTRFEKQFPQWQAKKVKLIMPFRYLLSGGISLRSLMFAASFPLWRGIENLLAPWMNKLGMFACIVLVRR
jgi:SAM-dependent methyltransferase